MDFADGRNVRHKLSTALTLPRTVTNNDAIDSRYFLESRIKHARKEQSHSCYGHN